jgi:hypothetical protein
MRAVSWANKLVKANSCFLTVVVGVIGRHAEGFLGNPIAYWRSEKLKFGELVLARCTGHILKWPAHLDCLVHSVCCCQ